jgi:predicted enzyme related to lactoylglutathione lyase
MFETSKAFSSFAVGDASAAATFYGDTLGMKVEEEGDMLLLHLGDDRVIVVYPKQDHLPANYTILNFEVTDVDAAVDDLVQRGVEMQRYEGFSQDEKGIARGDEGPPIAWFTDPAGNTLAVLEAS